jgi:hypothetical protein
VPSGRRYHCVLCGGPRIVVTPPVSRPMGELPHLRAAKASRSRRGAWALGAGLATAMAIIGGVIALVFGGIFDLGTVGRTILAVGALGPALLAGFGWRRVSILSSEMDRALDRAEETAASEFLQARPGRVDATALAAAMHVTEERAYELMAHAEVAGVLQEPRLQPPRMRVDDSGYTDAKEPEAAHLRHRR